MTNGFGSAGGRGFGIYVHTPFCVHKCSYCDFYSFTKYAALDFSRLVHGLAREIRAAARWLSRRGDLPAVGSVFFGGGTPSLVPPDALAVVFEALGDSFTFLADAEITLEANPETLTDALLEAWREKLPVNRVSLGAQSFQPRYLAALERLGSPESIRAAVAMLRRAGYDNFSLDLIFAIPGQTKAEVLDDIARAVELGPRHVSFYNLTLKPGHVLYHELPDDDRAAELYEAGIERLEAAGYRQYEISNFAEPGRESRHNLLYWNGGDFLGVGPSASSRFFWDGAFHHRKQHADLERYLAGGDFPEPGLTATTAEETVLEATFLELRRNEGVDIAAFRERYGHDLTRAPKYGLFLREGVLAREGDRLRLTKRGRLLADLVTRELAEQRA